MIRINTNIQFHGQETVSHTTMIILSIMLLLVLTQVVFSEYDWDANMGRSVEIQTEKFLRLLHFPSPNCAVLFDGFGT